MDYNKYFAIIDDLSTVKEALDFMIQLNSQLLVIKTGEKLIGICDSHHLLMQIGKLDQRLVYSTDFITLAYNEDFSISVHDFLYALIVDEKGQMIGWVDSKSLEIDYLKQTYSKNLRAMTTDLEAIVDSIYDEVLVVDPLGKIIRVSNRSTHNLWGVNPQTVIGENILDLEEKGWFKPSVTRKVIEEKENLHCST
ncbi:hypothetical protein NDK43_18540 [Neobacillus pocheonensis]|uniref:PAS domain-containing protein n=1 Tax=Neobacillus pocheonensis TaxID=363869 RepID=A0ABT0WCE6_9BACI|nr:hypothetical protein [Neobacillus pocheonensis]